MKVKHIPESHHTATPYLIVENTANAIEFYEKAFGATELMRLADPNGLIVHAEMMVGDSLLMLADEVPAWGRYSPRALKGSPVHINLYVEDADTFVSRAVASGANVLIPVGDQFYGDRAGRISDPFGHIWIISTRVEDVPLGQMRERLAIYMQEQGEIRQG